MWSVGGGLAYKDWEKFDEWTRETWETDGAEINNQARLPPTGLVYDYFVDTESHTFTEWREILPKFTYDAAAPYSSITVDNTDTVRFSYLMR